MIVNCPSCSARHNLGSQELGNGAFNVICRICNHHWRESPIIDVAEVQNRAVAKIINHRDEPEFDVQRLVEAARSAQEDFAIAKRNRLKRVSGWASLGLIILSPFAAAILMPETIVMAAPATIQAYDRLGLSVNIYGLDVRRVEQQNTIVDGQHVLMVKGEISNSTDSIRKMPWLRFALKAKDGKELYSWTLDTGSRPLRPGETTSFTTRVAQPPELSENLQIRFAHAEEIRSISTP